MNKVFHDEMADDRIETSMGLNIDDKIDFIIAKNLPVIHQDAVNDNEQ